jgi:hypothetical protein
MGWNFIEWEFALQAENERDTIKTAGWPNRPARPALFIMLEFSR